MTDLKAFGIETGQGRYYEEAFYGLVLNYTILFNKISKYLETFELTPAKLNVLMVIKHQSTGQGLNQREIGNRLMVSPSNMTRVLDKLLREKLIERLPLQGDKRVNIIRVSKKGSELLDRIWSGYMKTMKEQMDYLSEQDQKVLARMMIAWYQKRA
jgi:MarR family 2-MHQ and catechol resistance regulon transcriptional repressor